MSPLLNSPLRRGELTSDFVLHRGNSLKFIPFISSNSRYIVNLAECLGLILLFLLFTHNPINYQKANSAFVFEIWDLR